MTDMDMNDLELDDEDSPFLTFAPPEPTVLLGIDIGGTKIAAALVDADTGEALLVDRTLTYAEQGGEAVLERAIELARTLIGQGVTKNIPLPVGVGVGAGGQIDPTSGVILTATELMSDWAGLPLQMLIENGLGIPVAVDNDVNALGAGEVRYGAGQGADSVLFLALGTGVGGAILLDGRVYHGIRGAGGEAGHLLLYPDGLPCTCGSHGCLEQYTNGAALSRYYEEAGGAPDTDGITIGAEARESPDGPAAAAVRRLGEHLGLGLVSLTNLLDPDRIIIGGGLSELGEPLLAPARAVLAQRALSLVRYTPVVPAGLGANASVIGAASLALSLL